MYIQDPRANDVLYGDHDDEGIACTPNPNQYLHHHGHHIEIWGSRYHFKYHNF